jgi:hypothetical protein
MNTRAKKIPEFKSPDLSKMQEVIIDARTRIYIDIGADPVKARERYLERIMAKDPWNFRR